MKRRKDRGAVPPTREALQHASSEDVSGRPSPEFLFKNVRIAAAPDYNWFSADLGTVTIQDSVIHTDVWDTSFIRTSLRQLVHLGLHDDGKLLVCGEEESENDVPARCSYVRRGETRKCGKEVRVPWQYIELFGVPDPPLVWCQECTSVEYEGRRSPSGYEDAAKLFKQQKAFVDKWVAKQSEYAREQSKRGTCRMCAAETDGGRHYCKQCFARFQRRFGH